MFWHVWACVGPISNGYSPHLYPFITPFGASVSPSCRTSHNRKEPNLRSNLVRIGQVLHLNLACVIPDGLQESAKMPWCGVFYDRLGSKILPKVNM